MSDTQLKRALEHDCDQCTIDSYALWYSRARRWYYASLGGGLGAWLWGSFFWKSAPGLGVLLGTALGDGYAAIQPDPLPPSFLLIHPKDALKGSSTTDLSVQKTTYSRTGGGSLIVRKLPPEMIQELTCSCCQIVTFSSDPNNPQRAPISSRSCDHTICRSCVSQCHLALVERRDSNEEWIRCPLCNQERAFSSHDHLWNRSLCAAIALLEQQQQQQEAEVYPSKENSSSIQ